MPNNLLLLLAVPVVVVNSWTCVSSPATLEVDPTTFTYSLSVSGVPWLTDGSVAAHVGAKWFSSKASGGGLCTPIENIDCVGNDLVNHTQPSAGACCSACQSLPGCRAWSWQGGSSCYLKDGCDNPVSVASCVSGTTTSALLPKSSREVNGSDIGGAFQGFEVVWGGNDGKVTADIITTFQCYTTGIIGFTTNWPSGGATTQTTAPPAMGTPITHFPSFASTGVLGDGLRWIHVDGIWTLFEVWGMGTSHGLGNTDAPVTLFNASAPPGDTLIFSPLDGFKAQRLAVVPDPSPPSGGGGTPPPARLVMGLKSTITEVPPGFSSRVGIFPSSAGASAATLTLGALLQNSYATTRLPLSRDVLNGKLSYWSDNGATLFQSYWDKHCPTRNCSASATPPGTNAENTFMALKAYHTEAHIPVALYQMDTWWFPQGADYKAGGTLDCIDWVPRPDLFPNGLPYLTNQGEGGIPLLLYSWGFNTVEEGNAMSNYTWVNAIGNKHEAMVLLNQTLSFYRMIRDRFLAYNGTSFEEDNTASWTSDWVQTMVGVDTASAWWEGFATPWCESGIPVQACEMTAGDALETLKYGCLTSSRDTIDDVPGAGGNSNPLVPGGGNAVNFLHRWRVGQDRLLLASLGLRPFFDNVWSVQWQNASTWAGFAEYYVELAWALSVLSGGAVGFGDMPNTSNRTLIMTSCKEDGELLTASLPSFYIDDVYRPLGSVEGLDPTEGRVYQSPSFIPDTEAGAQAAAQARALAGGYDTYPITGVCTAASPVGCRSSTGTGSPPPLSPPPFTTLLAIDIRDTLALLPGQLLPDLSAQPNTTLYVVCPWARGFEATGVACGDGAPAQGCLTPFSPSTPLPIHTGVPPTNYTHDFELYSLSPVYTSGFALVGELGKMVRVSPQRFAWVAGVGGGMTFEVAGAGGEQVVVTVLVPLGGSSLAAAHPDLTPTSTVSGVMKTVDLSFPAGEPSSILVTCSGTGANAACNQS